jgi:hypothetical protein
MAGAVFHRASHRVGLTSPAAFRDLKRLMVSSELGPYLAFKRTVRKQ